MEELDGTPMTYVAIEELPEPELEATDINAETLLSELFHRFQTKKQSYGHLARIYFCLNLCIFTLPLLILQAGGAISYIFFEESIVKHLSACIAALSALLLGIQLKLHWGDSNQVCKQAGHNYGILAGETYYRWRAVRCGGNLESLVQFWAFALHWERKITLEAPSIPDYIRHSTSTQARPSDGPELEG